MLKADYNSSFCRHFDSFLLPMTVFTFLTLTSYIEWNNEKVSRRYKMLEQIILYGTIKSTPKIKHVATKYFVLLFYIHLTTEKQIIIKQPNLNIKM